MLDVTYDGERQWLAYEDPTARRVYAWVPNLGRFVFHPELTDGFYWGDDDAMVFTALSDTDATLIIDTQGAPSLDGRRHRDLLAALTAQKDVRGRDKLLGDPHAATRRAPSARQMAAARARVLRSSAPGTFIEWKSYPAGDKHKAQVAAYDLRMGKIAAVADLDVVTKVGDPRNDGSVPVFIARTDTPPVDSTAAIAGRAPTPLKGTSPTHQRPRVRAATTGRTAARRGASR